MAASLTVIDRVVALEQITYYHNDVAGNPIAVTDSTGAVLWRESYRPFGERIKKGDTSTGPNRIWFHSKAVDADTGLSYFGARYYDPVAGRFMGMDPVGVSEKNVNSFSRYSYGNNNPYKFTDLVGLITIWIGGGSDSMDQRPVFTAFNKFHDEDKNSAYFGWSDYKGITELIDKQKEGEPINLVGYSYGASTAAQIAAQSKRRINLLITIDPVGHSFLDFSAVKKNTDMWMDVASTPKSGDRTPAEFWAYVGDKWGNGPKAFADSYVATDQSHRNFAIMMTAGSGGRWSQTPAQVLNGIARSKK